MRVEERALELQDRLDIPASVASRHQEQKEKEALSPLQESLRRFRRDTRAMVSLGTLLFLVLLALVGPPIYK
ncbi:MAG: hypothetical protein JO125_01805, partial [Chloroflexi bacterium]|nr:hypothetical protein [Chloroflexota bacterium]